MAGLNRLSKAHALLTGVAQGIGLAVTQAYLEEGANCTAVDLAHEPSTGLLELLARYPQQLQYVSANVAMLDSIQAMMNAAESKFGPVTVLFNNAAVFNLRPIIEATEQEYEQVFTVNVKGMFFVMQAVLKRMVEKNIKGCVINMASQAGRRGEPLVAHYCASKAAVISYTQSAALAMASHGIRVNGIAPGVVDTPMWTTVDAMFAKYEGLQIGAKKRAVGMAVPLGRMGDPQDICGAAIFLASKDAGYITAQTLNVDGGNWMS